MLRNKAIKSLESIMKSQGYHRKFAYAEKLQKVRFLVWLTLRSQDTGESGVTDLLSNSKLFGTSGIPLNANSSNSLSSVSFSLAGASTICRRRNWTCAWIPL